MKAFNAFILLIVIVTVTSIVLAFVGYGVGAAVILAAQSVLLFDGISLKLGAQVFAWLFAVLPVIIFAGLVIKNTPSGDVDV